MAPWLGYGLSVIPNQRVGGTSTPDAPIITGVPTISGTIRTGQVLTATPASVSGSPTPTRTWQWVRAGVDIVGATAQTYTITNLDEGRNITVRQIETNGSESANATSTATAVPFLLDQLSGTALAAWSSRQLRSGVTALQRIRRSSDNLAVDIGPGADGRIDAAALAAHVGANSGFGHTLYDQSGNSRPALNPANLTQQPRIRNAGTNEEINSRITQRFTGTNWLFRAACAHAAGGASLFFVTDTNSTNQILFRERNNAGNARYDITIGAGGILRFQRVNDAGGVTVIDASAAGAFNGTPRVFALRDSGSFVEGFVNGSRFGIGTAYTRTGDLTGLNDNTLGGSTQTNTGITGDMPEFIVMSGAVSDEDLNTIIASQGGEYGITVVPFLTPVQQLTLQRGTGDGGSSWSTNLAYPDRGSEPRYLDWAKRAFFGDSYGWRRPSGPNLVSPNINSEGAVVSLPSGDTTVRFFFHETNFSTGYVGTVPSYGGRFRLTFTGSATVNFSAAGTNVTQIDANTYEFDCDMSGNKELVFTPTAFPIKVQLVKTTDIAAHASGQVFQQAFLDALPATIGCIRFMDWCGINNNIGFTEWSQRADQARQLWFNVPYEHMISLAVAKDADAWFCMPPAASDAFFTAAATFLRDNFPTNRRIRIELGNEIWNTGTFFNVGTYYKGLAESVWGVADGYNTPSGAWVSYYGKRFAQMMTIFNSVFAGQTERIIGVVGAQAANTATAIWALDATTWQTYESGSYVPPRTLAKELTIAPYISWPGNKTTISTNIKSQLDISHAAAVTYIKSLIPAAVAQSKQWINDFVPIAAARNLRLTMYEFSNHFDPVQLDREWPSTPPTPYPRGSFQAEGIPFSGVIPAIQEVAYSQEMADAQDEVRDYFKAQGGSLITMFSDFLPGGLYGFWGQRTHYAHTTALPRLVHDQWTDDNPRYFNQ